MELSKQLIDELHLVGIIDKTTCDEVNLQKIIKYYFCKVHEIAVEQTVMANNKIRFNKPTYDE